METLETLEHLETLETSETLETLETLEIFKFLTDAGFEPMSGGSASIRGGRTNHCATSPSPKKDGSMDSFIVHQL